jgi:hypothetical protein
MRDGRGRRVPARPSDSVKQREIRREIGPLFASTAAPGPLHCPVMAHVTERNGRADGPDHLKGELQSTDINENGLHEEWLTEPVLAGAQPDQNRLGDIVFADHGIVPAQAAKLALDKVGMDGRGRLLQQPVAVLALPAFAQFGKGFLDALAGAAECGRLFGEDLVAEQVERAFLRA